MESPDVLKMIFELDALQRNLTPLLPRVSQKLVADLLGGGVPAAKLGKIIGRSPSYVHGVGKGHTSLSPANIVAIVRFAAQEQKRVK